MHESCLTRNKNNISGTIEGRCFAILVSICFQSLFNRISSLIIFNINLHLIPEIFFFSNYQENCNSEFISWMFKGMERVILECACFQKRPNMIKINALIHYCSS